MARNFKRKDRMAAVSEINITPLLDLAFSLLIIFMITTPLMEQSIDIDLPIESVKEQAPPKEAKHHSISIDEHGRIYWGKNTVSKDELEGLLDESTFEDPQPVIHLRADGHIPYQKVIDVIDLIKIRKLSKLSLDTKAP